MNGIISAFCSSIGRVPTLSKWVRTRSEVSAACAAAASRSTIGGSASDGSPVRVLVVDEPSGEPGDRSAALDDRDDDARDGQGARPGAGEPR